MRDGGLDDYFFVGSYPTGAISELTTSTGISLVPISSPEVDKLMKDYTAGPLRQGFNPPLLN